MSTTDSPLGSNATSLDAQEKQTGLEGTEVPTHDPAETRINKLGWKKLTIVLIVEAIALGSLSIPTAFAAVGMVWGILLTVGLGLVAIYTGYLVGEVKIKHPHVEHFADAVGLIGGRFGYEITGVMFASSLILITGSHALTGTIAFANIAREPGMCALIWAGVSAVLLFALALPPTFADFAWLGYVDFASILVAIMTVVVGTGVEASNAPGGLAAVSWSVWAPDGMEFYKVFLAVTNITFAYSYTICQYTFMAEMHRPKDYMKAIWSLGVMEIVIYTTIGAVLYAFVGDDVKSPALLSASSTITRIAFGLALPVIFISGSIGSTVVAKYILNRAFPKSPIRHINTTAGWVTWISILAAITVVAWAIAEAVPFFNDLLGLISSLFMSGFSFYFPALFWFCLLKNGSWNKDWKNITLSIINATMFLMGITILVAGVYSSAMDISAAYTQGIIRSPFACSTDAYV